MDINTLGAAIAVAKSIPGTAAQRAEAAQAAAEAVAESIPQDYSTLSEDVQDLKSAISQGAGLTNEAKVALLALLANVAYIDDDGQDYYDALETALYPPVGLDSISAVFTQGQAVIYESDPLDTLKQYLVVTAHYSDSTTGIVTSYVLSGTLAEGTSTITVSYGGKTTSFDVIVSNYSWDVNWNYTMGDPTNYGFETSNTGGDANALFVNNGMQLTGGTKSVSFYRNPVYVANHGIAEIEFTIISMDNKFQGVVFIGSTGEQGFRIRCYNNALYWGTSTNTQATDVKIADISTNTKYKLGLEWSANGVIVSLDETTIHTGAFTSDSARFVITSTNNSIAVIHAVRLDEVAY